MKAALVSDDFRDWTGDLRLVDGREVTAISLRGDVLVAVPKGQVGNCEGFSFDRETGTALGGEQLHPEEMYRVRGETYLRRGAGKAAYGAYAATVGVSYPYDKIPPDRRQLWGEAMMGVGVYAGRILYDEFCDLHEDNLQGAKFLHWTALRSDERAGWDAAVAAGGEYLATYRKVVRWKIEHLPERAAQDLPPPSEVVRILNALLDLDRPGVSAAMLARHPVNAAVCDAPRVQVSEDGRLGWLGLLNALYPAHPDGSGVLMAIVDEGSILRFEPTDPTKHGAVSGSEKIHHQGDPNAYAQGGVVPGPHGKPRLVMAGEYEQPTPAHEPTPVTLKTPTAAEFAELIRRAAAPCLDPEKMNGFCDQFPGTDDPSPDAFPNPR